VLELAEDRLPSLHYNYYQKINGKTSRIPCMSLRNLWHEEKSLLQVQQRYRWRKVASLSLSLLRWQKSQMHKMQEANRSPTIN